MSESVTVPCPYTQYTQVTTATDKYALIYNPEDSRGNGERVRFIVAAVQPVPGATNYKVLKKDQAFEKPSVLDGHVWCRPESQDVNMTVTEED